MVGVQLQGVEVLAACQQKLEMRVVFDALVVLLLLVVVVLPQLQGAEGP